LPPDELFLEKDHRAAKEEREGRKKQKEKEKASEVDGQGE
jgi:hypothetical protein